MSQLLCTFHSFYFSNNNILSYILINSNCIIYVRTNHDGMHNTMVTSCHGNTLGIARTLLGVFSDIQLIILTGGQKRDQPVDFPHKVYAMRSFVVLLLPTRTSFLINSKVTGALWNHEGNVKSVMWSFWFYGRRNLRLNVFFDLRLNKRLSKLSWGWWFETPSCSLWRHCNELLNQNLRSLIKYQVQLWISRYKYEIRLRIIIKMVFLGFTTWWNLAATRTSNVSYD